MRSSMRLYFTRSFTLFNLFCRTKKKKKMKCKHITLKIDKQNMYIDKINNKGEENGDNFYWKQNHHK